MRARLLTLLTLVNLALLAYQVMRSPFALAAPDEAGMLRGTGLEIVDAQGRMRAQIAVLPADPEYVYPDGTAGYAETVILRLATADGKPRVKLTTSERGSGLMVLGATDTTHSILAADGDRASLLLRNDEKDRRTLRP